MINYTSGYTLFSSLRARAEKPLNSLVEKSEQEKRVSTKNLKKCLKAAKNSHLKISTALLMEYQERLLKVLTAQNSKKYEKKLSLTKEIIKNFRVKQFVGKDDIQGPYGRETHIAQPVADSRSVALSRTGTRLSEADSHMSEKNISPDSSREIHSVNSYDNGNERIETTKKEDLAEPGEKSISVVNDGFSKIIKQYTKHLNEARDKIDTMIEKYQKSEEIDVTRDLDEIYDNQETILHLLKTIAKETSAPKKAEKIASLKKYQDNIDKGLVKSLDAIHKVSSHKDEFFVDALFTRDRLLYASNDSFNAISSLNFSSKVGE